ncbi:MAG TPA: ABC transporter permease [Casimicrobiaceae bacterium]|jgi:sodium transport system permease protein|nr:ABC transporter permease [Casimicrobiaceae bacterium]
MNRALIVARKEVTETLRDRRAMLMTIATAALAGPIFLALIFNMIASQGERARTLRLPVGGAQYAPALVAFLEREGVRIQPLPADAEARIRAGELDVALVVDPAYDDQVADGKPAKVSLIYDRSRDRARASIDQAESLLRAYNRQWGAQRLMLRGVVPEVAQPLDIVAVDLATPQQSGALVLFLVAYYGLFAAVMGGMPVALDATAGERERQSLEPLLATPASAGEIVVGKWLAVAAFALLVVVVTLAGFTLTLTFAPLPPVGVPFLFGGREFVRFLVILLPMIALMPAVLLWLGSRGRTIKEAQTNLSLLLFVVSIVPVAQLFLQRREPDWLVAAPVSGQYLLLNRALRGEALAWGDLALSWVVPALLVALALWGMARRYADESVLAGK